MTNCQLGSLAIKNMLQPVPAYMNYDPVQNSHSLFLPLRAGTSLKGHNSPAPKPVEHLPASGPDSLSLTPLVASVTADARD